MRKSIWPETPFRPLRSAVARLPRGHPWRNCSLAAIKLANRISPGLPTSVAEVRPIDRPDLSFAPDDSMVMEAVYWFGVRGYEGIVSEVWKSLCAQSRNVLEIGGNVGLFSVIGGRVAQGRYTVVEPMTSVAQRLRNNLRRNNLHGVEVLEGAAVPAAEPREVLLSVPEEGHEAPVGAHLVEGVEVSGRNCKQVLSVHGYPITVLMANRDLVKIDAEGIEAALITASWDIILEHKPTLLIEVLPEANNLAARLVDLARQGGYQIHIVPEFGSDRILTVTPGEFSSALPQRFNSKDVVLSIGPILEDAPVIRRPDSDVTTPQTV